MTVKPQHPTENWLDDFLGDWRLPVSYRDTATRWFLPLADAVAEARCHRGVASPLLLGINGCQGSGKSTLSALLVKALERLHGLRAVALSLDDFYLTRSERQQLAREVHPLLVTRGVPGTHDIDLMQKALTALSTADPSRERTVLVPRFNKATDDRTNSEQWQSITGPVDVVIWEGWCLGVPPQADSQLALPVNALEAEEDTEGLWRHFVNRALTQYQPLFDHVAFWVMLQAPSFDCVYAWRLEQEQKLAAQATDGDAVMTAEQVARFIAFYQRLTEWGFTTVPDRVDYLFTLDEKRAIQGVTQPCTEGRL